MKKTLTPTDCADDPNADNIMWYCVNGGLRTHPVGMKLPNAFGLYDALGNAAEWQEEPYGDYKDGGPEIDPGSRVHTSGEVDVVYRGGGAWSPATICRAAGMIDGPGGDSRDHGLGMRVVRSIVSLDAGISDAARE